MTRRLFFHVGAPKTGTTYLQDLFARNRERLVQQGVTYPDTRSGTHFEAAIDLMDHPWGGQLEAARGSWDDLVAAAHAAPGDVLLSHEVFAGASRAHVEKAREQLSGFELHVVLTARDLARQVPAEWQQTVKHRGKRTFERFLTDLEGASRTDSDLWFWRVQSLPDVLTRWGAGLEPGHIHVVTVPQPGAPRDELWRRFAGVVGLDADADWQEPEQANESMGIAETQLVRKLNGALMGRDVDHIVYSDLVRELLVHRTLAGLDLSPRASVPPARRSWFDEISAEWQEWLAGSGVDVVGDREELLPVWPEGDPAQWADPDAPDLEAVFKAATLALAELVVTESERRKEAPAERAKSVFRQVFRR